MATIQLLMKASQVVDEVARMGPSTPAELAKAVSEPRPTVYRIISALEQADLVRQTEGGKLELGTGILRLGDAAVDALIERAELRAQLLWIREQLGASAFFCVLHDSGAVCLDQVDGSDVDLFKIAPGRTVPLHAGASSHVLLAFGDSRIRSKVLTEAPYQRLASRTPLTADELQARLDKTLADGSCLEDSEVTEGVASIGVPVHRSDGSLLGVLAVAGLRDGLLSQETTACKALQAAAAALTASLAEVPQRQVTDTRHVPSAAAEKDASRMPAVIAKADALMRALAGERIATSTRLSELLDEQVRSVYRMLDTLAEAGWVEQLGPRGAYRVGIKLLSLSGELTRRLDIRRAAAPVLREIHEATGETTFLCIRRGTRAVCIERVDGIRVNSRVLKLGESLPLHVGAAPRALLAFEDRSAWEDYATVVSQSNEPWRNVRSRVEFFADLEHIHEQGYVISDNNVTPGIAAIGAPIFNHRGEVVASLSTSGLREGILAPAHDDQPSVIELVCRGARTLSDYLGAPASLLNKWSTTPDDSDVSPLIV
ncbi:IclR family transcriptional regulator [Rhodococcus rhodochrous]|uniref:IclR family transcriptional regulator n=1 Tax=Rhodococcus rhodochrous TaxID=1829 RepID=UPI001E558931|nr:IclR family transcriptional regulator [Rhodococcus rhodochrous]MCD2100280.1 IclR family transcriptional regulator [Rhodococcus rhodochrous]MCD2124638.1 IclR family transcriptional regulator [Rhodococcus rhodochrous]MCQ4137811.1 IclR family transcriptional regulator [Rhodococcus rhodochrous]MDJ0021434.1 IclR family transcriptional regulator [Rhodococcus rhodochrous]